MNYKTLKTTGKKVKNKTKKGGSLVDKYEVIIGLEVHVQLKTKSKLFCSCNNDSFGVAPNIHICPTCMGCVGALPLLNKKAFEYSLLTGKALGCELESETKWDRKNYFYPDLPKAYQISQFDKPLARTGNVEFVMGGGSFKRVRINRLHLEEDAAKLSHTKMASLVDFNRAGTPLMEIVTEPDLRSPEEAGSFLREIRRIVRYFDVSFADMEKGHLRCDASISLRPFGEDRLYPRTEIKNLNSFKAVEKALSYEIKRQKILWEKDEVATSETSVLWDPKKEETQFMRNKEGAADYRYFPEPDIPRVFVNEAWREEVKKEVEETILPSRCIKKYMSQGLNIKTAIYIAENKRLSDYLGRALLHMNELKCENPRSKTMPTFVSWLDNDFFTLIKKHGVEIFLASGFHISEKSLIFLIVSLSKKELTRDDVSELCVTSYKKSLSFEGVEKRVAILISKKKSVKIISENELEKVINAIFSENSKLVAEYKEGKHVIANMLVGLSMKLIKEKYTGYQINPQKVALKVKELLV